MSDPAFYGDTWALIYDEVHTHLDPTAAVEVLAEIAGTGGIFNARSEARFFAMLANGGELDGVRLLPQDLVATFNTPRANAEEPDTVMFDMPMPITIGGFWYGGDRPVVRPMRALIIWMATISG